MATLREFILSQSSLPTGNTVREHIQNPGGGTGFVLIDTVEVEYMAEEIDVEVVESLTDVEVIEGTVEVEVIDDTIDVEIDS